MNTLPELLAPAGSPKSFKAALAAGADAIYCGFGNNFNARRSADNFDAESFEAACMAAHLAGVRVYVTVNIVIKECEMAAVLSHIHYVSKLGADAFIIQDFGLLSAVRHFYPEIECHVSTQANIHDVRGVSFCKELGANRVTLSRELTLDEIEKISKVGCDLEIFSHGALCFSYSGLCGLSSATGDRSANRGLCAQPCRLIYELIDETGKSYSPAERIKPLCPKDICVYDSVKQVIKAKASALKIEGRMKAPEYVYSVISSYRDRLDRGDAAQNDVNRRVLSRAFNRGFTESYLYGSANDDMMSYDRSNNRGQLVGSSLSTRQLDDIRVKRGSSQGGRVRTRTLTQAQIDIKLNDDVFTGDLLEVRPLEDRDKFQVGRVEGDAHAGDIITITTSATCPRGSEVRLIRSQPALDACEQALTKEYPRKRPVNIRIKAILGEPLEIHMATADGMCGVSVVGASVEPARTLAISKDALIEHVDRLGNTPFIAESYEVELSEGVGMGFSAVHKLRSQACDKLADAIADAHKLNLQDPPSRRMLEAFYSEQQGENPCKEPSKEEANLSSAVAVLVRTPQQAQCALDEGCVVYVRPEHRERGIWPEGCIVYLDEVSREIDHARQDRWMNTGRCLVSNMSELAYSQSQGAEFEVAPSIPVHNVGCLTFLEKQGVERIWLSHELAIDEVETLASHAQCNLGIQVAGPVRVMTSEHCILQTANVCIHDCKTCKMTEKPFFLKREDGNVYPVASDFRERTRLYSPYNLDLTHEIPRLLEMGVSGFMLDATFMADEEMSFNIKRIKHALECAQRGIEPPVALPDTSTGHLFEGIE